CVREQQWSDRLRGGHRRRNRESGPLSHQQRQGQRCRTSRLARPRGRNIRGIRVRVSEQQRRDRLRGRRQRRNRKSGNLLLFIATTGSRSSSFSSAFPDRSRHGGCSLLVRRLTWQIRTMSSVGESNVRSSTRTTV